MIVVALTLMGDWCASGYEGDIESKEAPAAHGVPGSREEREDGGKPSITNKGEVRLFDRAC